MRMRADSRRAGDNSLLMTRYAPLMASHSTRPIAASAVIPSGVKRERLCSVRDWRASAPGILGLVRLLFAVALSAFPASHTGRADRAG